MAFNPASVYSINDIAVVDVENGTIHPHQTVLVSGNRIEKIGSPAELNIPDQSLAIDGLGLFLMPGLIDAHVHYLDAPIFGRLMLANGVTLVRDMGMPNDYILKLRDELNRGEILGPEMIATGAILDGNPPQIPPATVVVETPEEGRAAVRRQADAGVDMLKVYSVLDKEVFLAIAAEAQKFGLKVVGHVPDSIYLEDAAAAGLRECEHWFGFEKVIAKLLGEPVKTTFAGMGAEVGYFVRLGEVEPQGLQEFFTRLLATGMVVTPTVVTFKNLPNVDSLEVGSLPNGEYISQTVFAMWKIQWAGQTEIPEILWKNWARMLMEMNKAGIPMMVGTDLLVPGIIPGYSVHEEMEIWQEAGIPPADILRSATLVPAQWMGLGDSLGSIHAGKTASMVLVRANPLEDIHHAQKIESVFLRGQYFDRKALDRLLEEARHLALNPVAQ